LHPPKIANVRQPNAYGKVFDETPLINRRMRIVGYNPVP
jgi:hypothetical protein